TVATPFTANLDRVRDFTIPVRKATRLSASDTDSWKEINAVWAKGGQVWRDPASGDFLTAQSPDAKPLKRPRIGLYRSWVPGMDPPTTRFLNWGSRPKARSVESRIVISILRARC